MREKSRARLKELFALAPVVPVITIEDARAAVPLARALVAGGLRVIEITLRTAQAVEASRAIIAEVPEALVGIGTGGIKDLWRRGAIPPLAIKKGIRAEVNDRAHFEVLPRDLLRAWLDVRNVLSPAV